MRLSHKRVVMLLACLCTVAFVAPAFHAAQQTPLNYASLFEKSEAMIPMRDGVKLHTEIYSPRNATEALPILMTRTPYGISNPDKGVSNMLYRYADMVPDGYIFVFQDIRGRYGSEGKFAMLRPIRDAKDANEYAFALGALGHYAGHVRHHRLAGEKRAAQQWSRWTGRDFLRWISCHHGHDQPASSAEGRFGAGMHGGHLDG